MSDQDHLEREPDFEINPVESDDDPDDVYEDPEMGDMQNIPDESFQADKGDKHGYYDHPES